MAWDAFLKIEGIEGESRDERYKGEIDVSSYSFGVQNSATAAGAGSGTGKASFSDISFVVPQSRASVPLVVAVATGQHVAQATLSLVRSTDVKAPGQFFQVTLTDVVVTSFHEAGDGADDVPRDAFSLSFSKIRWTYTPPLGSAVSASWDLKSNTKI